jgi:glycosyltransferase involved in cell wall biosynthesis
MESLVRQKLKEKEFDVVIASTGIMSPYAMLAPSNVVKVLEQHNSMSRWAKERYQRQDEWLHRSRTWFSWQKTRISEMLRFRQFDKVLLVSEQDCQSSVSLLPRQKEKFAIVPNGVDCEYHIPGLVVKDNNSLIFNGALTYNVNYEAIKFFLERIFPLVRRHDPKVSLTITGTTDGVDLRGLKQSGNVLFSGWVEDIRPLVSKAAACVVPILDGGGTRLKILEAMALGTPVVSTSKGAEGLNVTDGLNILLSDDPENFALNVLRIMNDEDLRQRIMKNGRQLVEQHYDWASIKETFIGQIKSAL